jgi:hypothetical protein
MPRRVDMKLLEDFLGHILDRYRNGNIDRAVAIGEINHLVAALDPGSEKGDDPNAYMNAVLAGDED